MKKGHFFKIPEGPADLEQLRRDSVPVDRFTRPSWLSPADQDFYRYLGARSSGGLSKAQLERFLAEMEELETAGLVFDADPADREVRHIYLPAVADYPTWSIGIYTGSSPLDLHPPSLRTNPVLTREDVSDVTAALVADPFLIRQGDEWFMFFEVLNWSANKGEIGLARSNNGFDWKYERIVLSEPFHLSYPYAFEMDGEYYMIPESRQCGEVRLYRADEFPRRWSLCASLLQGDLVDASIFCYRDRFWILAGEGSGRHDSLRLFVSETLEGEWSEHPRSPVRVQDARGARPAGRVLVCGDRIIRFAQNCEQVYGQDVQAFEILELTATDYSEHELSSSPILEPSGAGWNALGMHHVDPQRLGEGRWMACVDGWTRPDLTG